MIGVEKATEIILAHCPIPESEFVPLEQSLGRVLQEPVFADRDFPPFHRVAMDGIAIRYEEFRKGRRAFFIAGQAWAGNPQSALPHPEACLEVATGAVLPDGADTVVPYEQVNLTNELARIESEKIEPQQNIHARGVDRKAGDLLLEGGKRISAAEIATLATVGKTTIRAGRQPKIAIVATGDELVRVDVAPLPWQIRQSNPYALKTLLEAEASQIDLFHWKDDFLFVKKSVKKILTEYNLIVFSGGVSAGKKDFLPEILRSSGLKIHFHKVAQRPGKPLLFGSTDDGVTVFALPGNPVSAFMCGCRYVLPWLRKAQGAVAFPREWAILEKPLEFKPDLTWFVPVSVQNRSGRLLATPHPGHGSGDLANLQDADGFLELPRGRELYPGDESFSFFRFR